MAFKKISSTETEKRHKSRLQHSGRLGFPSGTITDLNLQGGNGAVFLVDEDAKEEIPTLLMKIIERHEDDPESYRVKKAGRYVFIATRGLFDHLGVDYRNRTIIYDIDKYEHDGEKYFRLIGRETRKSKQTQ